MSLRILHGDVVVDHVAADDRGLNYGDGLFETILVHHGQPVWWREHWQRLERGARVLGIVLPDEARVRREADALMAAQARAVLKLVLTRGRGGRGYSTSSEPVPTTILSLHTAPEPAPAAIDLRWCETTLAIQPRLAGIKHLNRLENVLARAEWRDPAIFEGLLRDSTGRVISATAANLFVRIDGVWRTPALDNCGIAGIARGWLLDTLPGVDVTVMGRESIENAEALFLCNAVRGILPVGGLGAQRWRPDAATTDLRRRLAAAQPAFAFQE